MTCICLIYKQMPYYYLSFKSLLRSLATLLCLRHATQMVEKVKGYSRENSNVSDVRDIKK